MTFGEFKKMAKDARFVLYAYEDIKGGFGKKGWPLYGNCDDLVVKEFEVHTHGYTVCGDAYANYYIKVFLANAE